jgi:DNA/RNA-binding domain of Phe-tRNA-synthetase-like protein
LEIALLYSIDSQNVRPAPALLVGFEAVFAYDAAIVDRYPAVRAGFIHATGLINAPSAPGLLYDYRAEQDAVARRLLTTPIADLPSIAAWRRAFTRFGAKPTQYRNAAEALLRRLTKHGDIPTINSLVDIGNLVSIRYSMPVAVVDLAGVAGGITVRFATGDEAFTDLGSSAPVNPEPGEVIFVDDSNVVCSRRWCWRQSAETATSESTVEALIVVEGLHDGAEADVADAVHDLGDLLAAHHSDSKITTQLTERLET